MKKFLLTGLTSLAICSGTHVLGMTLQTDLLDGVDGGSITKGAVTASLKHRHEEGKSRLSNQIKSSTAVVTVKVNGKVVGTLVGPKKGGQPFSLMQVVELDQSNPYPEVILLLLVVVRIAVIALRFLRVIRKGRTGRKLF